MIFIQVEVYKYICIPIHTHTPTSSSFTYNCCIVSHCMNTQFIYLPFSWWTLSYFQFQSFPAVLHWTFLYISLFIWVRAAPHSPNNQSVGSLGKACLNWLDTAKLLSNVVINTYTPSRSLSFHYFILSSLLDIVQLLNWVWDGIY